MEAADSEGLVSAMLRAKWNKTKYDTMDAVVDAQDLDAASEEFMIAALMKKLAALKANKTAKFAGEESASDEFMIKSLLAQLVALKRNKTAIKFADLEAMDETAADEVLLSKLFAALSAWKAKKANMTGTWKKFSADAVTADAADDEVLLTKLWAMLAAKKNKTKFATEASFDGASVESDPEFLLSAIWAKLAMWKNKTKFSAPEAADDETLLAMLYAKLAAKKNGTAWKKFSADDESSVDDVETNEYFLHRLNKTALASSIATKFNASMTAKAAMWNKVRVWVDKVEG